MLQLRKFGLRCLSVCAAAAMMASAGALSGSAASDPATYHNDMKTLADLEEEFDPYFLATSTSSRADLPLSNHWAEKDGMIERVNDINAEGATSNIATLVLRGYMFANFECTYKMKFGDANWGWAALGFRQQQPGNFFINDGAGVYLDMNGDAWLWGFTPELGNPKGGRVENFDVNKVYTVKVRVMNNDLSMTVDGQEVLKLTLPESFLYEGLVSLQSVGNNNAFSDFTITKLNGAGEPEPFLPVDTPATEAPTQGGDSQGDNTTAPAAETTTSATTKAPTTAKTTAPTVDETANEKDGGDGLPVWAIVAIVAGVVVVAGAVVAVVIVLRKKKAGTPPEGPDASGGEN